MKQCEAGCNHHGPPVLIVSISDGPQVTAADLAQFDAKWLTPGALGGQYVIERCNLFYRFEPGAWGNGEFMSSLARMYELTHQRKYLDHLKDFIELALQHRDDNYDPGTFPFQPNTDGDVCGATRLPFSKRPLDVLRGKNLPGWGGSGIDHAGLSRIDEDASNLYSYPIAVFARLVAEDQSLQSVYGNDALRYANAILETAWALMPQIEQHTAGNFTEAYLTQLQVYSTTPSAMECLQAYNGMKHQMDSDNAQDLASGKTPRHPKAEYDRINDQLNRCNSWHCVAGAPMAHNENGLYFMVLMELRRVLDSDFYRAFAGQSNLAEVSRNLFPALIAHHHRYFVNRLQAKADPGGERYYWNYQDDQPSCIKLYPEDVEHGQLDMRYMGVLISYRDWLNAHPSATDEPFPLDSAQLKRFANTFLEKIASGPNLNGDVNGTPSSEDKNGLCDGWVNLAIADPRVYQKCREVAQRVAVLGCPDSGVCQPYLGIGIHSSLLMNKRFSGPAPAPPHPAPSH